MIGLGLRPRCSKGQQNGATDASIAARMANEGGFTTRYHRCGPARRSAGRHSRSAAISATDRSWAGAPGCPDHDFLCLLPVIAREYKYAVGGRKAAKIIPSVPKQA